ncbi:MAG: DNA alkylation repair protein [Bacteroidales bacterium]
MNKKEIISLFYANRDPERGKEMSAYMRNKFPFLGIGSQKRAELSSPFLSNIDKNEDIDWEFVYYCFNLPEREFTYLAISYLNKLKKNILPDEFKQLEQIALIHPWWDSIDSLSPLIGFVNLIHPDYCVKYIDKWMNSDNLWLIRISIIYQLKYKKQTNIEILSQAILKNKSSNEFFINKAIGWALRQYSKTNPSWVFEFVKSNKLSRLSEREALRIIK